MKITTPGLVPVYTVAGESTSRPLPDWLTRRRKRSLKDDPEYQNRVELLQDFEFDEASICVRVSEDGNWVMSTGTYKPQMHVHSLPQLSLSWDRHTISTNVRFVLLGSDCSKSLHLQDDRRIEAHTLAGCHWQGRLPRYGRDLVYDRFSTEALIPAAGVDDEGNGEVFRLNLERGQYLRSYKIDVGRDDGSERGMQGSIDTGCVNTAAVAENTHNLLAFGTSRGTVEFWDPRSRARCAALDLPSSEEVTALEFDPSGLSLAIGASTGIVRLFDLRRPVPLLTKDQGYGFPVQNIMHLTTASHEKKVLSSDKKSIKLWDQETGDTWTSIEPVVDLNFVTHCKDSGMLLTANEGKQQHAFFIPQLGPAPSWCRYLDSITEEMEEEIPETYENYKFLTVPELKQLSLSHLVGKTNLLRPYMHGYFVATKLYEQARLIANPYVFEEERAKRVKEKIEKERTSRIRSTKKVRVNQKIVDKLLQKQEKRETVDTEAGILGDERFKKMFEDEEFKVDETTHEFRALNPSTKVDAPETDGTSGAHGRSSRGARDPEEDDDSAPIRKSNGDVSMRISSSSQAGRSTRDTALGSRAQKSGRSGKTRREEVVGEQQVTFLPERKKKGTEEESAPTKRRLDGRRSASGNAFRKL
ncbi:WD repeat protein [Pleurostoma richardsiae]|uniref:WD repeat protein n=1 Tax=Pleurostoma richardsiae TaxID=41990 RepID=A0AA38VM61_9PEZI|nr:WD repeat protein [Pleurostoma richardsiae]